MQKTKVIIFDCDGVLVDSEAISARILVHELANLGHHVSEQYVFDYFVGRHLTDVAIKIHIAPGTEVFEKLSAGYHKSLLAAFAKELKAMPGVRDVISNLRVPYCVATSSDRRRVTSALKSSNLDDLITCNIFTSSQVKSGKPAPDLFNFAAQEMGVLPDACLVIEDSFPGIQAAQAAGMRVWRFTGGSHFAKMPSHHDASSINIPTFDTWGRFFEMAPELKA